MIEFNPDTHEYLVNGKRIWSVTEILPEKKFYCDYGILENARQEGQENHELIKMYYDTGGDTFGDPYLLDYDLMIAENIETLGELVEYETPRYSSTYDFIGRPDVIYSKAIIDIKRSYERRITSLQLAGYSILAYDNKLCETDNWFIAWHDGKKFRLKDIYDPNAKQCFLALRQKKDLDLIIDDYMSRSYKDVSKIYGVNNE